MRLVVDTRGRRSDDGRAGSGYGLDGDPLAGDDRRCAPLGCSDPSNAAEPKLLADVDGSRADADGRHPCSDQSDHAVQSGGVRRLGNGVVDTLPSEHGDRRIIGQPTEPCRPVADPVAADGHRQAWLRDRVRRYAVQRQRRSKYLGAGLFADPAWDILLDLFVAEGRGANISVTSACIASLVPRSTALRWIGLLETGGFVVRRKDPTDRRVAYLALTSQGRTGVVRWAEAALVS
jgi:DNA-binding MarR family transcriptional regulator